MLNKRDNMRNLVARPLLLVISFGLCLVASLNLYSAQDYIKENPELDRLMTNASQRDRDQLNKMLSSMPSEDRQKFIQGMIDAGLNIEKNAITVERVFAKFHKGAENQKGLTLSNRLPSTGESLTQAELAELGRLPLNGVLEIVGLGKGGVKGAKKEVRIVLIMQKPVPSPVEFALPVEGSLMIVQMDDGWVFIPKEYARSDKTIAIKPGTRPGKTDVDYDIGTGRTGSEAYSWNP